MSRLALRLRGYWYIAARSEELRERPLARTLLGERLVLFRAADGAPAALEDRCAHRNMTLSEGVVRGGCVECPYHGWRYALDGACVEIPSLGGPPVGEVRIPAYAAAESDGFVWVYLGAGSPASTPPRFPHHGDKGWTSFLMVNRFPASAAACLENFLDCPHTAYVHQGWFRSREAAEVLAHATYSDEGVAVEFRNERDAESVVSRLLFPNERRAEDPSAGRMLHTDRFLMPTTSRVDYAFGPDRHFIITSHCVPVTEAETEVYTLMTYRFGPGGQLGPMVRLFFEPLSRRIIRQDVEVLREQGRQIERFGGAQFTSVETDLVGPHLHRLWRKAAGEPTLEDAPALPYTRDVHIRF